MAERRTNTAQDGTVTLAKQMLEQKAKFQEDLKTADARAEKRVEDKAMKGLGPLYAKLKQQVEQHLMEESENDHVKVRRQLKAEADQKIAEEVAALHGRYDAQMQSALGDYNDRLAVARVAWEKERASGRADAVAMLRQEILRVETREMETQKSLHEAVEAERDAAAQRVASLHADVVGHLDKALVENRDAVVVAVEDRLSTWRNKFGGEMEARRTGGSEMEREVHAILERMRDGDARARRMLAKNFEAEMRMQQEAFAEERKVEHEASSAVERAYREQVKALGQTWELQQTAYGQTVDALEEALGAKYDTMVRGLRERVELEREGQMKRAVAAMARQAQLETRNSRQAIDDQDRAEEAAAAKFHSLLGEIRDMWESEENTRSEDMEVRLRRHYEGLVSGMRKQCEMAMDLMHLQDEVWLRDGRKRFTADMRVMEGFKAKCQRLYGERLEDFRTKEEHNLRRMEANILDTAEHRADLRASTEETIQRRQADLEKWKLEHQAEAEARIAAVTADLEARTVVKLAEAQEELSELREANLAGDRRRVAAEAELAALRAERAGDEKEARDAAVAAQASLASGRELLRLLRQQWDNGGLEAAERWEIMARLLDKVVDFNPALMEGIEAELEVTHVSAFILRLFSHFQSIDGQLKSLDATIDTIQKESKFVPAKQVVIINKVSENE